MRTLTILGVMLLALPAAAQYQESITVVRILVDVRVTDSHGEPITGLTGEDFDVRIGGQRAPVESVSWIPDTREAAIAASSATVEELADLPPPAGRLIVVFVQTDFSRNTARVVGQMHFQHYAEQIIEALQPEDRVAVFSFDSHLKFRLDFSNNKSEIQAAIRDSMLVNHPPPPQIVPNPALAPRLDPKAMRAADDSETALILVGNALRPIPGPKSMLLLGWGLGQRTGRTVSMRPKWTIARRALEAARVSIFALDTTDADYHDLEIGLNVAAQQTGGFYAKTHSFPQIAVQRLQRTLTGHYELELRRPEGLKPGTHPLDVRVKTRGVTVLAPSSWMDR